MILLSATLQPQAPQFPGPMVTTDFYLNQPNIGLVKAYHQLWQEYEQRDLQGNVHDDLEIFEEGWALRVTEALADSKTVIVGLGGASGIGVENIYKRPFRTEQLIRLGYRSNQQDWETHGMHEI